MGIDCVIEDQGTAVTSFGYRLQEEGNLDGGKGGYRTRKYVNSIYSCGPEDIPN
jgi:hypothetical protein